MTRWDIHTRELRRIDPGMVSVGPAGDSRMEDAPSPRTRAYIHRWLPLSPTVIKWEMLLSGPEMIDETSAMSSASRGITNRACHWRNGKRIDVGGNFAIFDWTLLTWFRQSLNLKCSGDNLLLEFLSSEFLLSKFLSMFFVYYYCIYYN